MPDVIAGVHSIHGRRVSWVNSILPADEFAAAVKRLEARGVRLFTTDYAFFDRIEHRLEDI
jgi:hypothetical protein